MTGFELMLTCLALNVYKEARSEPPIAQLAVALVTLNRAKRDDEGDVCKTVFKQSQFSWTITDMKHGKLKRGERPNRKSEAWRKAMIVAKTSLTAVDFTGGATHYHASYVKPYWAKHFVKVGKWGDHIFYKETR